MPSDHVVDVVEELPKEQADKILDLMEEEKSEEVQELLEYAREHRRPAHVPRLRGRPRVRDRGPGYRPHPQGGRPATTDSTCTWSTTTTIWSASCPLHKLLTADPATPVRSVRREGVESVFVDTDQEEVARLVQRHHLIEVPVVDSDRRLLGTISVDDVIDVIRDEATEDIQRLAGVPGDETVLDPPKAVFTKRLVWRLINLATAVLAASVIGLFEGSIRSLATPCDLHADRGLDGGHRDHPDRHRGRPRASRWAR